MKVIAGTGGQIMPPIMEAGAFIMSEVTGVPFHAGAEKYYREKGVLR